MAVIEKYNIPSDLTERYPGGLENSILLPHYAWAWCESLRVLVLGNSRRYHVSFILGVFTE